MENFEGNYIIIKLDEITNDGYVKISQIQKFSRYKYEYDD